MQSQIQQPQVVLHQTSPIVRTVSSNSFTSNNTAATKGRVRWTPELHETFVEAVNQLGGMESESIFIFSLHFHSFLDKELAMMMKLCLVLIQCLLLIRRKTYGGAEAYESPRPDYISCQKSLAG